MTKCWALVWHQPYSFIFLEQNLGQGRSGINSVCVSRQCFCSSSRGCGDNSRLAVCLWIQTISLSVSSLRDGQIVFSSLYLQSSGLHFRHTDNTVQWLRAMESVGLPKVRGMRRHVHALWLTGTCWHEQCSWVYATQLYAISHVILSFEILCSVKKKS